MPKKKNMADELADLLNPAPAKEFDPEADVFGAGPALEESDDELAAAEPSGRRKGKEGGRLRGDIVMEGQEYAGHRSSRAAVFGAEDSEDGGDDDEDASEEGEGEEEDASAESEDEVGAEDDSGGEGEEQRLRANGSLGLAAGSDSEEDGVGEEESEEQEQEMEEQGTGSDNDDAGWLGNGDGAATSSDDDDAPPEAAMAGSGGAARYAARATGRAAAPGSEDEGEGNEDEDEGRGRSSAAAAAAAAADDEMAALEREYEAMQQDEQAALAGLKERAAKERRKAQAVQAQKSVWHRGLETRILLQRALAGANRLPQGDMAQVAAGSSPDIAAAFAGLAADAAALAGELLQLLGALAGQNGAIAEAAAAAGVAGSAAAPAAGPEGARGEDGGRDGEAANGGQQGGQQAAQSEALWAQMAVTYASFAPFRDASIDRWHRKTMLTTGGTSLRGGQLKALNQSVSTQVAQLMQDSSKVVRRTRLPRSAQQQPQQRLLCPDPEQPAPKRRRVEAEDADGHLEADASFEDERDPETFDDTEFYQTLLREFLEGSADAGGANWHTGPKQRKAVDRRASKGRKLRYHVHEKLVNFMTPVELAAPQYAAQLFSNLFGGGGGGAARQ